MREIPVAEFFLNKARMKMLLEQVLSQSQSNFRFIVNSNFTQSKFALTLSALLLHLFCFKLLKY